MQQTNGRSVSLAVSRLQQPGSSSQLAAIACIMEATSSEPNLHPSCSLVDVWLQMMW